MSNIGLVLEGGALRGLYTCGVLDFFMEKNIWLDYSIGVSAGACNGVSYVSKQKERSRRININYVDDKRYLSFRNLLKEKSVFGIDFAYNQLPNVLDPFDYKCFFDSKEDFTIVATDCITGKPVYFNKSHFKEDKDDILTAIRASSSMPFLAPVVHYNELALLDGGISDPIPVRKAEADGNEKNIIVLTRNRGYRKKPFRLGWAAKKLYSKYPGIIKAMEERYSVYNDTLDYIENLERENKAFVIAPSKPIEVGRLEKNKDKLAALYENGYRDAEEKYEEILKFIK